ncbi:MAG TPA: AI-2E family transporter [Rubrobacter sp.]|jgi:predicted PurR-regulated permease PerM|nr:AI-2E family transporter [Rubrobacter sp.]
MSKVTVPDETNPGEATAGKATAGKATAASTVRGGRAWPTPIRVPRRLRTVLAVAAILAVVAALVLVTWKVPLALVTVAGGLALATVLSFPVRLLSRLMPRRSRGLAVVLTFMAVAALIALATLFVAPLLARQFGTLTEILSSSLTGAERYLLTAFEFLDDRGLLPGTAEQAVSKIEEDLSDGAGALAGGVAGSDFNLVSGVFGAALSLFGVVFVAAYLLADSRRIKLAYLRAAPTRYRHDARDLWDAFEHSFSRYLSGLLLDLFIQGAVSALVLYLIGVPYAIALGAWVFLTGIIPYAGAWLGAIPAVAVALTVSPTATILTLVAFLIIQQVEGNYLMPRIHGKALHIHPVLILLAVIVGGGLAGLLGVLLAVPILAVSRVLYDFFSVRLLTGE